MPPVDHAIYIKTIFCDIDGCLVKHYPPIEVLQGETVVLNGTTEKILEWVSRGYTIILTTGRPESLREFTEQQLRQGGIVYHKLIMDLPRGQRVVINDYKPGRTLQPATGICIKRDEGIADVDI